MEWLLREWKWHRYSQVLSSLRLIVLDVDGVLTDGGLWFDSLGQLQKRFDVRDGLGIRLLMQKGIIVAFLSGGKSGATEARASQLGVQHCMVEIKDKLAALNQLQKNLNINKEHTAFVGDDLNDLVVQRKVRLLIAPLDACRPLRLQAQLVLHSCGGNGAVRELSERIIKSRGEWNSLSTTGWLDTNI